MTWEAYLPDKNLSLPEQAPMTVAALNVWSEARGQSWEGQVAVAYVVLNRAARHPRWPADPKAVILQKWQFSWTMDPECVRRALDVGVTKQSAKSFRIALAAAKTAMDGFYPDPTGGADHYYNPKVANPTWASDSKMEWLAHIGDHVFMREHG